MISDVMMANGAHCVSAHEIPRKEMKIAEIMKQSPIVEPMRQIAVRMWESIHARGSVSQEIRVLKDGFLACQLVWGWGVVIR